MKRLVFLSKYSINNIEYKKGDKINAGDTLADKLLNEKVAKLATKSKEKSE